MSDIVDFDDEVLRIKAAVLATQAANEVLQSRLAHATWHVTTLRGSLDAAQARLVEYREALEDSQAQLHESRLEVQRAHAEVLHVHEELQRTNEELRRLHTELATSFTALDQVLASPSWRVTAPLRAAKHVAARKRGTKRP